MSYRWIYATIAASALVLSGCSSGKVTVITPSAKPTSSAAASSEAPSSEESTEAEAPQQTLDPDACVDVTSANLDLATANDSASAQKAADTFDKYSPPAPVQEAIDHFVQTKGVQFDDPKFDEFNKRIDDWVKEVCPL